MTLFRKLQTVLFGFLVFSLLLVSHHPVLCAGASPGRDLPETPELITLGMGQQLAFSGKSLTQVSIGNPEVAQAQLSPHSNQILLTALNPGSTDLILWDAKGEKKTYPLRVISGSIREHFRELGQLVSDIEGVSVKMVGERLVIEGEALRPQDLKRISQLAQLYPNVSNLVEMSEEVKPILTEEINRKLEEFGFHQVRAKVLGPQIYITGEIETEKRHEQALLIARAIFPDTVDLLNLGTSSQPQIRLDLTLMEINRSNMKAFGVRWQSMVTAQGNIDFNSDQSRFGLASNPAAAIDMIQTRGWGRVLTNPRLLCRSGEKANFHAGGEIPIRLISERTAKLEFKPYGIMLKMEPRISPLNQIALGVETEISSIDGANSVDGIPAFLTRKLSTQVSVGSGESIVLGGLTDVNDLKSVQKIPLLGHIPVFGELFKSRSFRSGKTELIVFITPVVMGPTGLEKQKEDLGQFQKRYEEEKQWHKPKWND